MALLDDGDSANIAQAMKLYKPMKGLRGKQTKVYQRQLPALMQMFTQALETAQE